MIMFKHILVPTDGTPLSRDTSHAAIALAKALGARITAYHAKSQIASTTFSAAIFDGDLVDEATRAQFEKAAEASARSSLDFVEGACGEAGVPCETMTTPTDTPAEAILEAASQCGADLIFMASHGRKGFKSQLIGSETQKVLTHSKIPVLVYRWGDEA
jgi:nucleotide-binding universal stress UspA family protein